MGRQRKAGGSGQQLQQQSAAQQDRSRSKHAPLQQPPSIPNLYWRAMDDEALRCTPRYVSLPPLHDVKYAGPATGRFVRQSTPLWDMMHQGVLSTGILKETLGFQEAHAAQIVGGVAQSGHGGLTRSYHHLRETVHPGTVGIDAQQAQLATSLNLLNLEQHNSTNQLQQPPPAVHANDADRKRQQRSALAASYGIGAVRAAWGSRQEASSLYHLLHLFPNSTVHEVGMFNIELEDLPEAWGFAPGSLPPMGASPDGLICHSVQLEEHKLAWLEQTLEACRPSRPRSESILNPTGPSPGPSSTSSATSSSTMPSSITPSSVSTSSASTSTGISGTSNKRQASDRGTKAPSAGRAGPQAPGMGPPLPSHNHGRVDTPQQTQLKFQILDVLRQVLLQLTVTHIEVDGERREGEDELGGKSDSSSADSVTSITKSVTIQTLEGSHIPSQDHTSKSAGPAIALQAPANVASGRPINNHHVQNGMVQPVPTAVSPALSPPAAVATIAVAAAALIPDVPAISAQKITRMVQHLYNTAAAAPEYNGASASTSHGCSSGGSSRAVRGRGHGSGGHNDSSCTDPTGSKPVVLSPPAAAAAATAAAAALHGLVPRVVDTSKVLEAKPSRPPRISSSSSCHSSASSSLQPSLSTHKLLSTHKASATPLQPSLQPLSQPSSQPSSSTHKSSSIQKASATPSQPSAQPSSQSSSQLPSASTSGFQQPLAATSQTTPCSTTDQTMALASTSLPLDVAAVAAATAATAAAAAAAAAIAIAPSSRSSVTSSAPTTAQDGQGCQLVNPSTHVTSKHGQHNGDGSSGDNAGNSSSSNGSGSSSCTGGAAPAAGVVLFREVVEVKNTCPFGEVRHYGGSKGKPKVKYIVSDKGPRDCVSPQWVPQLQLHMLATGCWSALLVSRSAIKGVRVFRMFRDDEYIYRMLKIVSRFYTSYVQPGREPPPNMFCKDAEYKSFLQHTVRLSRCAREVTYWPSPPEPPGSDSRAFI